MMSWRKVEYLGWGAYGVLTVVCAIPLAVLVYLYGSEELHPLGRVFGGIFAGGVIAAVLTFAGNELLQRRIARQELQAKEAAEREVAERKLARKLRKKEKKQQRSGRQG